VGRLSKTGLSIITSKNKNKGNKNKTKITSKGRINLNYREMNNEEAHQANDNRQKEKAITRLLEIEIGRGR
jgi:hypothetical protein